jgi:hypothetical protein
VEFSRKLESPTYKPSFSRSVKTFLPSRFYSWADPRTKVGGWHKVVA